MLDSPGVDQPFIRHEIRPFIADLADLGFGESRELARRVGVELVLRGGQAQPD